jgi:hypothetical protein
MEGEDVGVMLIHATMILTRAKKETEDSLLSVHSATVVYRRKKNDYSRKFLVTYVVPCLPGARLRVRQPPVQVRTVSISTARYIT